MALLRKRAPSLRHFTMLVNIVRGGHSCDDIRWLKPTFHMLMSVRLREHNPGWTIDVDALKQRAVEVGAGELCHTVEEREDAVLDYAIALAGSGSNRARVMTGVIDYVSCNDFWSSLL